MGHQGSNASHDIFFESALPVTDAPAFVACIRELLVREIAPGTVVIDGNLETHRNKDAAHALRDLGCWFPYLPPYSPDLNPSD